MKVGKEGCQLCEGCMRWDTGPSPPLHQSGPRGCRALGIIAQKAGPYPERVFEGRIRPRSIPNLSSSTNTCNDCKLLQACSFLRTHWNISTRFAASCSVPRNGGVRFMSGLKLEAAIRPGAKQTGALAASAAQWKTKGLHHPTRFHSFQYQASKSATQHLASLPLSPNGGHTVLALNAETPIPEPTGLQPRPSEHLDVCRHMLRP